MEKEVLNAKETAELLGISTKKLYMWCNADIIPHRRIGTRLIRFSRKALLEWLAGK